jgi:hypothetical protein
MVESLNGQSQSERDHLKPKAIYTGERFKALRPEVYRQVAELLAQPREHISYSEIMRRCHVNRRTIEAVQAQEAKPIAEREKVLVNSFARIAQLAADQAETLIPKMNGRDAIVTAAVATEKILLLSGDPTIRIEHSIEPGVDPYKRLQELQDSIKPKAIEARVIEPVTDQPAFAKV